MTDQLREAMAMLTPSQSQAVKWEEGPALVLAGPGVGKTQILTHRIARILQKTPNRHFRILALTFTTKAGDEMRGRVEALVPDLVDRTVICTFHAFCAQILRQHGSHLGINTDFGVYSQDSDRKELLREALAEAPAGAGVSVQDVNLLQLIDQMRSRLEPFHEFASRMQDPNLADQVRKVNRLYEGALKRHNVMDFNGMILNVCKLVREVTSVAALIRQIYRYWLIDEFQDTLQAQYQLLNLLAGSEFRNIFAVADEDQIIFQWAGASFDQLEQFRRQFKPRLFQIIENKRCPKEVITAANNLVSYNNNRTEDKKPLVSTNLPENSSIHLRKFASGEEEALGVAQVMAKTSEDKWGKIAILGRTRSILEPVLAALQENEVKSEIRQRRDEFSSPQFVWLQNCLDLSIRPADRQTFVKMVKAANRFGCMDFEPALLMTEAETCGSSYLEHWADAARKLGGETFKELGSLALQLIETRSAWTKVRDKALVWLPRTEELKNGSVSDVQEDKKAWISATQRARQRQNGKLELPQLLQEVSLSPKEPPSDTGAIRLMTIHSAKGLEFDYVWIVGMAEEVLPSWHSLKLDAPLYAIEEERRSCFVAITRTRKTLVLSYATEYNGYPKCPSRFLSEMSVPRKQESPLASS